MCLQFHPSKSNIIAAGTFNGEIYLYDIAINNELCHSIIDEYYHRECVTSLLWL